MVLVKINLPLVRVLRPHWVVADCSHKAQHEPCLQPKSSDQYKPVNGGHSDLQYLLPCAQIYSHLALATSWLEQLPLKQSLGMVSLVRLCQ